MPLAPADVLAAADRLRGQVVATPLIGGLVLPGMEHLRIKPEILQPGGSIWFRGYLHWLLRQMGALKGLVVDPALGARPAFAAVVAAKWLRVPCVVTTREQGSIAELEDSAQKRAEHEETRLIRWLCAIDADDANVSLVDAEAARKLGFRKVPGRDDDEVQAGIATVGLELGREAPDEVQRIGVAPGELGDAILAGLQAAGRRIEVAAFVQAEEDEDRPRGAHERISEVLRLQISDESWMALICTAGEAVPAVAVLAE